MSIASLPEGKVFSLREVDTDPRRAVLEHNGGDYSIQHFTIGKKRSALGNHYHKGKREIFTILMGGGYVVTQRVDEDGRPIGTIFKTSLKEGNVIVVDPFTTHTFVLEQGTEMICFSSAPFDPNNMDHNEHILVDKVSLEIRMSEKA